MAKQLIVCVNGKEKKIAIIEDDKVSEFYIERGEQHQGIVGNIYKGRVMRVLPGMQSAFVDIGLERDAFLYVSDFFDEEEEFERIVIDKSKKGTPDAEHAAAQEIAQNRVEREQRIEETQEKVEPMQEAAAPSVAETPESGEAGRRRGRRGRRRSRWEKPEETTTSAAPEREEFDVPDTPFVAGDPSIERIVDEEESAVNGEMFKDARLQERLFDQIHAVEFNMEDDYRNAQVGSLLSSGLGDDSFERVDDGETEAETAVREARHLQEAHLAGFNDDAVPDLLGTGSFERVSDDEDSEAEPTPRRGRKVATSSDDASAKKKRTRPAAGATKGAAKKKASSKKPSKKRATDGDESAEGFADSEARVGESQSRAEFAT
ncbi:MAG TPA: hypothetical protein VIJ87_17745, partial [Pyrinomonadaceae bacterium]